MREMTGPAIDWKGIAVFLLITFAITYSLEGGLMLIGISPIVRGVGQYLVLIAMWVPAFATLVTAKFITREGFGGLLLRFGDWREYVKVGLAIPAGFVLIYGLTWLLGLGQPDWELRHFQGLFTAQGIEPPPIPSPFIIWPVLFFVSLLIGPIANSVIAFGEELGWRGYLLPKLMPLGKPKAYLLMGLIWGMWHWPLVLAGFMYPGNLFAGLIMFTTLTTVLGIYINELTLRQRSSILAGWAHGVFNTQRLGMWALLFPGFNPWLGGFSGLLGLAFWLLLGLWESRRARVSPAYLVADQTKSG